MRRIGAGATFHLARPPRPQQDLAGLNVLSRGLLGGTNVLERFGPAILVEIEARHHGYRRDPVAAVRAMLEPLGYRGSFFGPAGVQTIEEFSIDTHQQPDGRHYANDFLFIRHP